MAGIYHGTACSQEVLGVMNLRGMVIPVVDLAVKLGMEPIGRNERSAIVVAEVGTSVIGLVVDGVSDLLTIDGKSVQPLPSSTCQEGQEFARGMITHEIGMICFLDLDCLFSGINSVLLAA